MISRRSFLKLASGSAALGATIAGSGLALASEDTTFQLDKAHVPLHVPHLPATLQGFRIGVLSDVHLGPSMSGELLQQALGWFQESRVGLLALVGDYIWIPNSPLSRCFPVTREKSLSQLSGAKLTRAIYHSMVEIVNSFHFPYGVYAIYGNHDRWEASDFCPRLFEKNTHRFLVNAGEQMTVDSATLSVFGTDDYWTGAPRIPDWGEKQSDEEFRLLLCHNPDFVSWLLQRADVHFDLAVCGHTHGGQIVIPGFGALHYNIRDTRFRFGLVSVKNSHVYTTRGLGVVEIPYRINCQPEATLIELVRGPSELSPK